MTTEPLLIALTFDAEADAFDASIESADALVWRGIEEGIPRIDDMLADVRDSFGGRACATWFVRCDDQIESLTGEAAHLLHRYADCWRRHQALGDEIAFHPHLYRRQDKAWLQETEASALADQINRTYAAMQSAGFTSQVSRIGEAFGSNAVMAALDAIGIRCDSTAMPGRVRQDETRSLDWSGTPDGPYQPSVADYRVAGQPARRLLEVPMTMALTRAEYDQEPLRRYIDLSFHPHALRDGLTALLPDAKIVVTVTHPSTILPSLATQRHGLLSFSPNAFAENLRHLTNECTRLGRPFRFITLRDRCLVATQETPQST